MGDRNSGHFASQFSCDDLASRHRFYAHKGKGKTSRISHDEGISLGSWQGSSNSPYSDVVTASDYAALQKIMLNIAESHPGLQACMEGCDLKEFDRTIEHITQQLLDVLKSLLGKLLNDRRKTLL